MSDHVGEGCVGFERLKGICDENPDAKWAASELLKNGGFGAARFEDGKNRLADNWIFLENRKKKNEGTALSIPFSVEK